MNSSGIHFHQTMSPQCVFFLSLTFLVSLFVTTLGHQSLIVSKKNLFSNIQDLEEPSAKTVNLYTIYSVSSLLMTSTSGSHVEGDKKKEHLPAWSKTLSLSSHTPSPCIHIWPYCFLPTVKINKI